MPVITLSLGPWQTNSHILHNGREAVMIDVGDEPHEVLHILEQKKLTLTHMLVTHLHCDHVYGVAALHKKTGAVVLVPGGDDYLRGTADADGGDGWPRVTPFAAQSLELGRQTFGAFTLDVLHTPGHTAGSVSLYQAEEGRIFSGDVLFHRSVGRSDFLGGNQRALMASIRRHFFTLPPETIVHSGHGPDTTIGEEMQHNPYCREILSKG